MQVLPAKAADVSVVRNLSGYYIYDFTEYMGWACPESGQFGGCDELFAEWEAGTNHPFLVRVDGELAGFAAVGHDAASGEFYGQEFFILRKFRRRGVGRAAAYALFDLFPGPWRVDLLMENIPALRFWQPTIQQYIGAAPLQIEEHESPWGLMQTLRFRSGR
jgi:predicted acetyltransferase